MCIALLRSSGGKAGIFSIQSERHNVLAELPPQSPGGPDASFCSQTHTRRGKDTWAWNTQSAYISLGLTSKFSIRGG